MDDVISKLSTRNYTRKLVQRVQKFGTITVPVDVLVHWDGVDSVRLSYDEALNVLFVCPQPWIPSATTSETEHDL